MALVSGPGVGEGAPDAAVKTASDQNLATARSRQLLLKKNFKRLTREVLLLYNRTGPVVQANRPAISAVASGAATTLPPTFKPFRLPSGGGQRILHQSSNYE